jgi:nucleoside-diphosphate-sugar epimerase
MRILIIGGTRFTGPFVVRGLIQRGHDVTVFHRGEHEPPADFPAHVQRIRGDRREEATAAMLLRDVRPDVVVDMIAFTRGDADSLVRTFRGVAKRLVVPSSQDVYRAYGRLHRTEPGRPDPTPLDEDAPLRERPSIHGDRYEKLAVERVVMSQPDLPATILRLPAIYGPGDHRLYEWTRRMIDGRPAVLLESVYGNWRWTHGYVENMAHAIVLAATDDRAAERIYNVGESGEPPRIAERVAHVAAAANWGGRILGLAAADLPKRLTEPLDWSQDWVTDSMRIRLELGYEEILPYEEGLRRTAEWHRAHPNEKLAPTPQDYAEEDAIIAKAP